MRGGLTFIFEQLISRLNLRLLNVTESLFCDTHLLGTLLKISLTHSSRVSSFSEGHTDTKWVEAERKWILIIFHLKHNLFKF